VTRWWELTDGAHLLLIASGHPQDPAAEIDRQAEEIISAGADRRGRRDIDERTQ
jgi:hypothetical protein